MQEISSIIGAQAVVASIDYKIIDGKPIVFKDYGLSQTQYNLYEFVAKCEDMGVGEIFLQNIAKDGKASGYDVDVIKQVVSQTRLLLPVRGLVCPNIFYKLLALRICQL